MKVFEHKQLEDIFVDFFIQNFSAIENGNPDIMSELLDTITQLPSQPSTIHLAVEHAQVKIVELLLKVVLYPLIHCYVL